MVKKKDLENRVNHLGIEIRFKHRKRYIENSSKENRLSTLEKGGNIFYRPIQPQFSGSLIININGQNILQSFNHQTQFPLEYLSQFLIAEFNKYIKQDKDDDFFYTLWKKRKKARPGSSYYKWKISHVLGAYIDQAPEVCFRKKDDSIEISWDFNPEDYSFLTKTEKGCVLVPLPLFKRTLDSCLDSTKRKLPKLQNRIYGI